MLTGYDFKTKVVIEALKERMSMSELAQRYELAPQQKSTWKREFLDSADKVFAGKMKSLQSSTTRYIQKELTHRSAASNTTYLIKCIFL